LAFLCVPDDDGLLVPLYDGDRFLTWLDVGDRVRRDYTWDFRSWGDIPLLGDTFSIGKAFRERNCKDLTVIWNLAGIFGDQLSPFLSHSSRKSLNQTTQRYTPQAFYIPPPF